MRMNYEQNPGYLFAKLHYAEECLREGDLDRVTRAIARRAIAGVSRVHFLLLGPHPSLAVLLRAGFRLVDRDTWMCSRLDLVDGRRSVRVDTRPCQSVVPSLPSASESDTTSCLPSGTIAHLSGPN